MPASLLPKREVTMRDDHGMLTLYGNLESGNVYKVRLLLAQLGLAHRRVEVNQVRGEPMTAAFRAINPIGKVPALRFADGRLLSESGAILYYLAQGSRFWPAPAWDQAEALRWMFFEQYSHEPCIAVNRYLLRFTDDPGAHAARVEANAVKGHHALSVMEQHLTAQDWFTGETYGIADIALFAYSHVADEGGFDLAGYPALCRWLARVAAQPGHIALLQESSAAPVARLEALA
jgi:glutathione S-transferase